MKQGRSLCNFSSFQMCGTKVSGHLSLTANGGKQKCIDWYGLWSFMFLNIWSQLVHSVFTSRRNSVGHNAAFVSCSQRLAVTSICLNIDIMAIYLYIHMHIWKVSLLSILFINKSYIMDQQCLPYILSGKIKLRQYCWCQRNSGDAPKYVNHIVTNLQYFVFIACGCTMFWLFDHCIQKKHVPCVCDFGRICPLSIRDPSKQSVRTCYI